MYVFFYYKNRFNLFKILIEGVPMMTHTDSSKRECLDWVARKNILIGIAKGLFYLHEDSGFTIIHCDLKPSNILLDGQLNPKIADFGSAKLFNLEETHGNTNLAVGTL